MNKTEIELLSVIKYTTKDNRNRCLLRFIPLSDSSLSTNDKFKGLTIVDAYFDGHEVFDKIPIEYFGKRTTAVIESVSVPNNPLKQSLKITKINDISLV